MERIVKYTKSKFLLETGVIAILRHVPTEYIVPVVQALYQGGVRVLEVTMNTKDATHMIANIRERYGDQIWIGAGTVLTVEQAREAVNAGAEFFVTPNVDRRIIQHAVQHNLAVFPGALTSTEIVAAYEEGATAVKVFPSCSVGSTYFLELRGPLPHIPLMAVGGISASNAGEFIRAGAIAVGVGSALVSSARIENQAFDTITTAASCLVEAVRSARPDGAFFQT
ncbi:MAG: bifunctional 4-hydroxy-2-oxoglutarate aldolase/2-dehydro-3-deoxy-phosphogluconate aldolase [Alicyclobacillus sp.]|nr:bifunctional 4-hydroxy-2-oxoglutarate aldolase/2-dehydro-3-deoxy-phosphogluconate aldolase [Alicyclobacillus sp.]